MKKFVSLLLWAALLLTAAGCSRGPAPTEPTEPTEAPTQPVVEVEMDLSEAPLKFEGVQLQFASMLEEGAPEADVVLQAASYFEKTTGADVEILWLAGDRTALAEKLAAGEGADIFEIPGGALQEGFLQYGLDLTEMADASGYEENWKRSGSIKRN